MLDRAQGMSADGEPNPLLQRFALQRHIAKIRQETALGPALGMAHIVAGEHGFAGELATTGHGPYSFLFDCTEPGAALKGCRERQCHRWRRYTGETVWGQGAATNLRQA